jgi:hypothetical protein
VRPSRFELLTFCFGGKCSIQLSYGRTFYILSQKAHPMLHAKIETVVWSRLAERWLSGRKQRFAKPS